MADAGRPMWDRRKVLTLLVCSAIGQTLLIVPGERLMGAALLGLTAAYALFFFRNVRLASRLEGVLRDSGDLPDDYDETDDSTPIGAGQPWVLLLLPAIYAAGLFDKYLDPVVTLAVWIDLVRLIVQVLMVVFVHADLRHKVQMLTDPAYLDKAIRIAREQEAKRGQDP